MVNGDTLNPANGTTANGSPCVSQRTVVATGKVYVNKQPLAKVGDTLNSTNNIRITTGDTNDYVV
jgi:hypothetical protein